MAARKLTLKKRKLLDYLQQLQMQVLEAKSIDIVTVDRWDNYNECPKDLVLKDGCMQTVGKAAFLGTSYELKLNIK